MYNLLTDNKLLIAFYGGDHDAFEKIYKKYWMILFNEARKILKDNELAKDVVQDVFVNLLNKRQQDPPIIWLDGFLFKSLRNRVFNCLDHEKVRETFTRYIQKYVVSEISEIEEEVLQKPEYLQHQLQQRLERAISSLPPKMKTVFELAKNEQMSYKAIAVQTGSSVGTVKKQVYNALNILRSKLLF